MLRKTAFSLSRVAAGIEGSAWNEVGNVAGFASRVAASKVTPKRAPVTKLKKDVAGGKAAVTPAKGGAPASKAAKAEQKKDPPKRMSAYAMFMKHEFPGIQEASPGKSFAEVSKKVADLWKELPEDRRAKYLKEAEKTVAATKDDKLKRPPNAYAVFAKETFKSVKEKYPHMDFPDLARQVGRLWKTLPPLEKAARNDRYQKALEEFRKKQSLANPGPKV